MAPAVSMVLPAGSPLYWPSFHAATRATAVVTAAGAVASVYVPMTAMPADSRLKP